MRIRGAWNIKQLPMQYVVELEDSTLKTFDINPFKKIAEADLKEYEGYHPRKCSGVPMPFYLYPFYGLEKSEGLTEVLRVRISPQQKEKLDNIGDVSSLIRNYIDSL